MPGYCKVALLTVAGNFDSIEAPRLRSQSWALPVLGPVLLDIADRHVLAFGTALNQRSVGEQRSCPGFHHSPHPWNPPQKFTPCIASLSLSLSLSPLDGHNMKHSQNHCAPLTGLPLRQLEIHDKKGTLLTLHSPPNQKL